MDMNLGPFEKNYPSDSSSSLPQPRHSNNDDVSSETPETLQDTPRISAAPFSASHRSFQTVATPHPNSYESFSQRSPRSCQTSDTNLGMQRLPQLGINAPELDGTPGSPNTVRHGTYSYPLPVLAHDNDAFLGFNDTVAQQQQPYIWSQQDFTLHSTATISPQNLNLQSYQDYFESPSSPSSEFLSPPIDNRLSSSASPTCTIPPPPKPAQKVSATSSKGSRPTHNMVEKQYRMRLNAHFDELLAKIPKEHLQSGSDMSMQGKNTSKTETLVMAEHYIKTLEKDEKKLSAENKELLYHFESLKAEWIRNGGVLLP